jgi:leucyl aminopeptidase (aminopeptidase T)
MEVQMKYPRLALPLVSFALVLSLSACEPAPPPEASAGAETAGAPSAVPASVDLSALAESFVGDAARVEEGDLVLITGSTRDQLLLEEMAVQVRRRGAFPMISLGSDRLAYRMVAEVPERFDAQGPALQLATADVFDVVIAVDVGEDPDLFADIAPERIAAITQAGTPAGEAMRANRVRQVFIGNSLYPTPAAAARLGMELGALQTMFWEAVFTDPALLQERAASIRETFEGGSEVQVTHPNGTDLSFGIQGRPVFVSDGVVSSEDTETGGAGLSVWLPAGEVFLTPVPGTANGQLVVEKTFWEGQEITGLRMTFENGMMTAMTAENGLDKVQADYAAAGACRDQFSVLDVGINPGLDASQVSNWVSAGMVTLAIGSNVWAGGELECEFSMNPHLSGTTLTVDGVAIVEGGQLR